MKTHLTLILIAIFQLHIHSQKSAILLDSDLIFYYDFDSFNEDTLTDLSPNKIIGRIDNVENSKRSMEGYVGNTFEFSEEDSSRIFVENQEIINPEYVTVMAWIYQFIRGSDTKRMEVLEKTPMYWLNIRTGNRPGFEHERGILRGGVYTEGGVRRVDSEETVPMNQWVHVAMTYDGEYLKTYIDGEIAGELESGGNFPMVPTFEGLGIGTKPMGFGRIYPYEAIWDGYLDEVILLSRAMSENEINKYITSVSESFINESLSKKVRIFPNPAIDYLCIDLAENETTNTRYRIISSTGQILMEDKLENIHNQIELPNTFMRGMYFFQVYSNSQLQLNSPLLIK